MLTDGQLLRYNRQLLLNDFDIAGQERLLQASVLVVERGEQSFPGPPPDFELQGNDRLLIFGSVDAAGRLSELLQENVAD